MRQLLSTILALTWLTLPAVAQIDTIWTRVLPDYGGNTYDLTGAVGLADGGFALCAYIQQFETNQDNLVMRTDSEGEIVWIHDFRELQVESPWAILEANDGSLRIFGTQYSFDLPLTYIYMLALSSNGDSLWTSYIAASDLNHDCGVTKLSDGSFIIVADTTDAEYNKDAMLIKVDSNGNPLWRRYYDYGEYTYGRKVIESADGTLLLAGDIASGAIGGFSTLLVRLDAQGNVLWDETYEIGNAFGGVITALEENRNGDIFLSAVLPGIWWWPSSIVLKYNAQGEFQWSDQSNTETGIELLGIAPDAGGGCLAAGRFVFDFTGFSTPVLYDYGSDGIIGDTWQNGMQDWGFSGISAASSGGQLAFGYASFTLGYHIGFLVRMGEPTIVNGRVTHIEDSAPLAGIRVELSSGAFIQTDENGYYSLAASEDTVSILVSDACIAPLLVENIVLNEGEVNTHNFQVGIPEYLREPSSLNLAIRYDIAETATVTLRNPGTGELTYTADVLSILPAYNWLSVSPTQGAIPAGQTAQLTLTILADSEQSTTADFFATVRVRNHSCPDSIDDIPIAAIALNTDTQPNESVTEYALHSAFPNPFNSITQLRFDLPAPGKTAMDLFDIQGRFVRSLAAGYFQAGSHTIQLDMSDAASGVYFVRMHNDNFTASRKIILLK
ncbi:T9SS C-terminal target domain-containing protein [bacterium]|nr:MAG: T9SS C-terminal target domain-containing protein [bacterium]